MKKVPLRMCIVTREKLPKFELIRVVRTPEGNVVVDTTSKLNGRGVYLKKDLDVVKKAKNTKILEKQLETQISDDVYKELESIIGGL